MPPAVPTDAHLNGMGTMSSIAMAATYVIKCRAPARESFAREEKQICLNHALLSPRLASVSKSYCYVHVYHAAVSNFINATNTAVQRFQHNNNRLSIDLQQQVMSTAA